MAIPAWRAIRHAAASRIELIAPHDRSRPMNDAFGNTVTVSSALALQCYERAVDAQLHAWPGAAAALDEALAEAPDFVLAHALRALLALTYSRIGEARAACAAAEAAAAATSERERSHVAIVASIVGGRPPEALARVQQHAQRHPTDVLSASTALGAYGLFAFSGRRDHDAVRREFVETLSAHLPGELPWLLMQRGWVRIECGDVAEGLAMARRSLALRPDNGHGAHVLLHGLYEASEPQQALDFLRSWLPGYADDALMWGHLQWHGALAELALGDDAAAWRRLLGPVLDYLPRGAPYMGLPDTASLLWRLGLRGASAGALPWPVVQAHADRHFAKGSNVFGELHLALLAAARQDAAALHAGLQRLGAIAGKGHEGAPVVAAFVRALLAQQGGDSQAAERNWQYCLTELPRIGGSHAQRAVVELSHAAYTSTAALAAGAAV
jgi:tetratricopeptide (TPR) repeat protein